MCPNSNYRNIFKGKYPFICTSAINIHYDSASCMVYWKPVGIYCHLVDNLCHSISLSSSFHICKSIPLCQFHLQWNESKQGNMSCSIDTLLLCLLFYTQWNVELCVRWASWNTRPPQICYQTKFKYQKQL